MARFHLINPVTVGSNTLLPGQLLDDANEDANAIRAAGGLLWPFDDGLVAEAATRAQNMHNRAVAVDQLESTMNMAILQRLSGNFALQTQWAIDPLFGRDSDAGTLVAPLRTQPEMQRRIGDRPITVGTTVSLLNDFDDTNQVRIWFDVAQGGTLTFLNAKPLVTNYTSLAGFTSVVNIDSATNQAQEVSDTALAADWGASALLNTQSTLFRRIRITSGPRAGAIAYPVRDINPGTRTARTSAFLVPSTTLPFGAPPLVVSPVIGDPFVVESGLLAISDLSVDIRAVGRLPFGGAGALAIMSNIALNNASDRKHYFGARTGNTNGNNIVLAGCDAGRAISVDGVLNSFTNCKLSGATNSQRYGQIFMAAGLCTQNLFVQTPINTFVQDVMFELGGRLGVTASGSAIIDRVGIFNATDGFTIFRGGFARLDTGNALYGLGNTLRGVKVESGAIMSYANKPTITGAGGDAMIGGLVKTWAQVPFLNGYDGITVGTGNGAGIVLTA